VGLTVALTVLDPRIDTVIAFGVIHPHAGYHVAESAYG
jgi:hypothetical protein